MAIYQENLVLKILQKCYEPFLAIVFIADLFLDRSCRPIKMKLNIIKEDRHTILSLSNDFDCLSLVGMRKSGL